MTKTRRALQRSKRVGLRIIAFAILCLLIVASVGKVQLRGKGEAYQQREEELLAAGEQAVMLISLTGMGFRHPVGLGAMKLIHIDKRLRLHRMSFLCCDSRGNASAFAKLRFRSGLRISQQNAADSCAVHNKIPHFCASIRNGFLSLYYHSLLHPTRSYVRNRTKKL